MRARIAAALLIAAVSLLAGIVIGRNFKEPPYQPVVAEVATPRESEAPPAARAVQGNLSKRPGALAQLASMNASRIDLAEALRLVPGLALTECKEALRKAVHFGQPEREILLKAIITHWASLDPDAVMDEAFRFPASDVRRMLGPAAAKVLAVKDSGAALARVRDSQGRQTKIQLAQWILPAVSRIDPEQALSVLQRDPLLARQDDLFNAIAAEYGAAFPAQALAWASALGKKDVRERTVRTVWNAWADTDPASAASALAGGGETPPSSAFESVARSWSKASPLVALEWVNSLPEGEAKNAAARSLVLDASAVAPSDAARLIRDTKSDALATTLARVVASSLLMKSVEEALAWAEALPEGAAKQQALRPIMGQLTQNDPAAALRYAEGVADKNVKRELVGRAISQWSKEDPDSAYSFASQMPAGQERDRAIAETIKAVQHDDPQKAMEWFRTLQTPEAMGVIAEDLVRGLVATNAAAALQFASTLPAEAQGKAYYSLVRGWAFEHMTEAGQWINGLSAGPGRDAAIKAYVSVIDGRDPALATTWAASIQDPVERTEAMFNAFERWADKDAAAAQQWLHSDQVSIDFKPFFEKHLKERVRPRER